MILEMIKVLITFITLYTQGISNADVSNMIKNFNNKHVGQG